MKNKKGFIATSLIYSFFLVFVTLFLGIIASYLQDKIYLSTIEKSAKDGLNKSIGIKDIEVGSVLKFDKSFTNCSTGSVKDWVVVDVNNKDNKVILYSYDILNSTTNSIPSSGCTKLKAENLSNDINLSNQNPTTYNNTIYNFNTDGGIYAYSLNTNLYAFKVYGCDTVNLSNGYSKYNTDQIENSHSEPDKNNFGKAQNCIGTTNNTLYKDNYRLRYEWSISDNYKVNSSGVIELK